MKVLLGREPGRPGMPKTSQSTSSASGLQFAAAWLPAFLADHL